MIESFICCGEKNESEASLSFLPSTMQYIFISPRIQSKVLITGLFEAFLLTQSSKWTFHRLANALILSDQFSKRMSNLIPYRHHTDINVLLSFKKYKQDMHPFVTLFTIPITCVQGFGLDKSMSSGCNEPIRKSVLRGGFNLQVSDTET